jgi:hypothetical protein
LFKILQSKNIANLLLKSVIEIYSRNKIKLKISHQLSEEHTVNHRVRQGCPLTPTLFNILMNEIITVLFVDDQVIIADSEVNLQRRVFILQNGKKFWNGNITRKICDDGTVGRH